LQTLLHENSGRTFEKLAEALNIGKIVSNCLHKGKDLKRRQMDFT